MWGWVVKVGAWAWAHKQELGAAWEVYRRLRAKRKAEQEPYENARDYYARVGKTVVQDVVEGL